MCLCNENEQKGHLDAIAEHDCGVVQHRFELDDVAEREGSPVMVHGTAHFAIVT